MKIFNWTHSQKDKKLQNVIKNTNVSEKDAETDRLGKKQRIKTKELPKYLLVKLSEAIEKESNKIKRKSQKRKIKVLKKPKKQQDLVHRGNLGKGNFGSVDSYWDPKNHKHYAEKTEIKKESLLKTSSEASESKIKKRVIDNAELLKKLQPHQNIVEVDFERNLMVFAGHPLEELTLSVKKARAMRKDPYSIAQVSNDEDAGTIESGKSKPSSYIIKKSVKGMLSGLSHLHKNRVVHLDIKPANILIAQDGNIRIADFGTAKKLPAEGELKYGSGDLAYMPPEIALRKDIPQGKRSDKTDMWSLGAVIYELVLDEEFCKKNIVLDTYGINNSNSLPLEQKSEDIQKYINQRIAHLKDKLAKENPKRFTDTELEGLITLLTGTLQVAPEKRISARNALVLPFITKSGSKTTPWPEISMTDNYLNMLEKWKTNNADLADLNVYLLMDESNSETLLNIKKWLEDFTQSPSGYSKEKIRSAQRMIYTIGERLQ